MFNVFESLVLRIRSNEAIRVEQANFPVLFRLSRELENDELPSSLFGMIEVEFLSLDEAILLLRLKICLRIVLLIDLGVWETSSRPVSTILDDLGLETFQILFSSPSLHI